MSSSASAGWLAEVVPAILALARDADPGGLGGAVADPGCRVWAPSTAVAEVAAHHAEVLPERHGPPLGVDAVLLLDGELADAGEHAEELLADLERLLRPGALLAVSAAPPLAPHDEAGARTFSADDLGRLLGHRGFAVIACWAPGAARRRRGDGPAFDQHADAQPGVLDAGDVVVAVGRLARTDRARSERFFATLPRKVIAAAVVCRDDRGRLLLVHDSFKQHWTIPGGVVDPGEDPLAGAVREAWEEAGVRVRAGALLGVFAGLHPDRLVLLYAATPAEPDAPAPATRHPHEIDAAEWVPMDEALHRLAPSVRAQVTRCLDEPGRTWPAGGWER